MKDDAIQGERRSGKDRRQNHDRRVDIRFEPGKQDRRQSKGRRKGDGDCWDKAMRD